MFNTSRELEAMSSPLFSIVTVCFNDRDSLGHTYQSLVRQTNKNYEWIVVDGESKDGTIDDLQCWQNANLHWISEVDKGLYDAMNKGIDLAVGEYLIFINAGDALASNDVLRKLSNYTAFRPDFIYGDAYELTQENELLYKKARSHKYIWYGMFAHHQSMLYKRSSLGSMRYRLQYSIGADYAFTAEFMRNAKVIQKVDFPLCIFQQGGLSTDNAALGAYDQWQIRRDILGVSFLGRVVIRVLHGLAHGIKTFLPAIYKKLRFT